MEEPVWALTTGLASVQAAITLDSEALDGETVWAWARAVRWLAPRTVSRGIRGVVVL